MFILSITLMVLAPTQNTKSSQKKEKKEEILRVGLVFSLPKRSIGMKMGESKGKLS